ncbi:MAG: hypothetical protein GY863_22675 [bacterium]|nr:hypothetical protein [bacterium]
MNTATIFIISGLTLIFSLGFFMITAFSEKFLKREKIRVREYNRQDELELMKYKRWE